MPSELDFRIEKLKVRPVQFAFDEPIEEFPDLLASADQNNVEFLDGLSGALTAAFVSGVIEVEGQVSTRVQQPCCRCLVPVVSTVDVPVVLTYVPLPGGEGASLDEEKELSADEIGLIPCPVDELDLHPELSQEVLMALPQRPICKEDCAGLCPVCGVDLNSRLCQCEKPVFHGGLAALKNFKVNK